VVAFAALAVKHVWCRCGNWWSTRDRSGGAEV